MYSLFTFYLFMQIFCGLLGLLSETRTDVSISHVQSLLDHFLKMRPLNPQRCDSLWPNYL